MTGVEKVRDLATVVAGARIGLKHLPHVHTPQQWRDVIKAHCMGYGLYLRGLIEGEQANHYKYFDAGDNIAVSQYAITVWKEVLYGDQTTNRSDHP